ncbi:MAG: hypothetical protein PVF74_05025 [Anaerolineales bacterium]|jgi:hypothetical protein
MKKLIILITSLTTILILAACSSASAVEVGNVATEDNNASANEDYSSNNPSANPEQENNFPMEMQLMLGTVMLEGTSYVIDPQQAAELLPLWKALRSLSESDTTAIGEVEAVINQIQRTMTTEQMEAINGMELSMSNFGEVAEILGLEETSFGGRFGEMSPEMQATIEAARASGQGPPGGFGGIGGGQGFGGGQGPGGEGLSPEQRQTAVAERGELRGAGFRINTTLLNALIEFLENKTQ